AQTTPFTWTVGIASAVTVSGCGRLGDGHSRAPAPPAGTRVRTLPPTTTATRATHAFMKARATQARSAATRSRSTAPPLSLRLAGASGARHPADVRLTGPEEPRSTMLTS